MRLSVSLVAKNVFNNPLLQSAFFSVSFSVCCTENLLLSFAACVYVSLSRLCQYVLGSVGFTTV